MARPAIAAVLAMAAISLGGCGTFADRICGPIWPDEGPPLYPGVQMDLALLKEGRDKLVSRAPANKDDSPPVTKAAAAGWMLFAVADVPFSALADTIFLPNVLLIRWQWPARMGEAKK